MGSSFQYVLVLMSAFLTIQQGTTSNSLSSTHQEWKKLILTHHWPVTVCKMEQAHCESLPDYWTLHGLWPDKAQMCNHSWPFDYSQIQDILSEMNQYWPDLLHPNKTQFWKHEWQKHGTCAASLECLNSQHKYFSKGLDLYKQVDLNSALEKSGIIPSTTYYQMTEIHNAILNIYGVVGKIQCLPPQEGETAQTLAQIEICFTKELQIRNCTEKNEELLFSSQEHQKKLGLYNEDISVCDNSLSTYYPPAKELLRWQHRRIQN
ncbi:ribonuclease T2-like [Rhinophrynus dorsalis]